MGIRTIVLDSFGFPLEVNPALVGSLRPHPDKADRQTLVAVFGIEHRVRGRYEDIRRLLHWEAITPPVPSEEKMGLEQLAKQKGGQ